MNIDDRSRYLKEMGITEWSLRSTARASPPSIIPSAETHQANPNPEPKVYWLFYGQAPSGDQERLFQNILLALGLLPGEWEWRSISDTQAPNTRLPCVAFAFGEKAAQALSGEQEPLTQLRDVVLEIAGQDIPLIASFELAHCLSRPKDKALLWQDLLLARSVLQSL
jgi:DNA polymerase III psi subunit